MKIKVIYQWTKKEPKGTIFLLPVLEVKLELPEFSSGNYPFFHIWISFRFWKSKRHYYIFVDKRDHTLPKFPEDEKALRNTFEIDAQPTIEI
jgi:hypothetical protein